MDINIPVENPELVMKIHDYMSSQSNADEKRLRNNQTRGIIDGKVRRNRTAQVI